MARHGYHPTARRLGFVRVECDEERVYYLRFCEYGALAAALDRGDLWYSGTDNLGIVVRIRLDSVMGVEAHSPAAVDASVRELDASADEDPPEDDGDAWKKSQRGHS